MNLLLTAKRAVITGSTSGIGEQIAKTLAAEGVQIVVHGRRKAEADRVVNEIVALGGTAVATVGELRSESETKEVAAAAIDAFGGIDMLVTNAATFPMKPWLQSDASEWVDLYDANVASTVRLVTALVPAMVERRWGRVVMLGSFLGPMPGPPVANYATTKAATIAQAVSLAKELGGTGVTANTVSPGPIRTPGFEASARAAMSAQGQEYEFGAFEQFYVKQTSLPVGRIGSPVDIAHAVAFLCSPLADFITGANLRVDGGIVPTSN